MSSKRESENRSASACTYATTTVQITDEAWAVNDELAILNSDEMADYAAGGSAPPDQGVKCQALPADTTIRVAPMERFCGGWSTEHFHEKLMLPDGSNAGQGMVVQLEGMARECLVVALSPYHKYELGKTYAIHFGANGNMQTVLRRHVNYNEAVDVSIPSRVCAENTWVHYWIILQNGKLSAGVGKVPGKHVIGVLDDSMYNMLRSGVDAVKYVGLGNSALQRNARDLKVRNVRVMAIPPKYQLEGIPLDETGGFVNVTNLGYGTLHASQQSTGMPTDSELLAEYERERAKAKARAEKFGIEYKEPAADAFLKVRKQRRHPMSFSSLCAKKSVQSGRRPDACVPTPKGVSSQALIPSAWRKSRKRMPVRNGLPETNASASKVSTMMAAMAMRKRMPKKTWMTMWMTWPSGRKPRRIRCQSNRHGKTGRSFSASALIAPLDC